MIHLAFKHDIAFSGDFQGAADADRRAVEAFGEALAGSDRPLVIASGTLGLAPGRVAHRTRRARARGGGAARPSGPQTRWGRALVALARFDRGVRSSVVRLPPTVHGDGDKGFVATLVEIARDKAVSGYIGDGSNRWPAVHRLDAAHLFRLAWSRRPAGSALHAVADEGVPIRDIAEVIGRHLDVPVVVDLVRRMPASTSPGWPLPGGRQSGVERVHPRAVGMAAHPAGTDRRSRTGHYFKGVVPLIGAEDA